MALGFGEDIAAAAAAAIKKQLLSSGTSILCLYLPEVVLLWSLLLPPLAALCAVKLVGTSASISSRGQRFPCGA